MGKLFNRLFQILFVAAFFAIIATGVVISYPKYRQARGLEERHAEIQRRIEEKNREISELKENRNRFRTDREFVEALARENRRVYPGEMVFVFDK